MVLLLVGTATVGSLFCATAAPAAAPRSAAVASIRAAWAPIVDLVCMSDPSKWTVRQAGRLPAAALPLVLRYRTPLHSANRVSATAGRRFMRGNPSLRTRRREKCRQGGR